jgi:Na+/proline symporter
MNCTHALLLLLLLLLCTQARHINRAEVLTLPDFYARKYGKLFEVLVSLTLCTSFISLLAGNFVGEHTRTRKIFVYTPSLLSDGSAPL